jgi:hypothetical protein
MSDGPCSIDGNIGMPLQLTGEIQVADREKLNEILPNDLSFSFGSFRTKPTLIRKSGSISVPSSDSDSDRVNLHGAYYSLASASIFRPQHLNFSDNQKNIAAEIIFTFRGDRISEERPFLFFLCFPLYKSSTGSSAPFLKGLLTNEPITSMMSIQDLLNEAKTFIFYNSCIPMITLDTSQMKNYKCCALVASHALPVFYNDFNNITYLDYMLPWQFLIYSDTIVDFKIDNSKFTFIPSSIKRGTAGKTYRATVQTNASIFFTRFSKYTYSPALIEKANKASCKTDQINTSQLKCFTIKPKSDVKGGRLLIDPKTGKRMDQLLSEGEPGDIKPKNTDTIATIAGTLGGLLALVIVAFFIFWFRPKVFSETPSVNSGNNELEMPELHNKLAEALEMYLGK